MYVDVDRFYNTPMLMFGISHEPQNTKQTTADSTDTDMINTLIEGDVERAVKIITSGNFGKDALFVDRCI